MILIWRLSFILDDIYKVLFLCTHSVVNDIEVINLGGSREGKYRQIKYQSSLILRCPTFVFTQKTKNHFPPKNDVLLRSFGLLFNLWTFIYGNTHSFPGMVLSRTDLKYIYFFLILCVCDTQIQWWDRSSNYFIVL